MRKGKQQQKPEQKNAGKEKILDSLTGTIDEVEKALDEEISEAAPDGTPQFEALTVKKSKVFFTVGLFIMIMAVIGIVSSVLFVVDTAESLADNTALKAEFVQYLYPVVMTDPPAFESIADMPSSAIINAGIWNMVLKNGLEKYESDGLNVTVSQVDVESSIAELFGYGVSVEHQSVGSSEAFFSFDEETKSYSIPVQPNITSYYPIVSEISNVGELYTVKVEYIPQSSVTVGSINYNNEPQKVMIYTISRSANNKVIQSIRYDVEQTIATS